MNQNVFFYHDNYSFWCIWLELEEGDGGIISAITIISGHKNEVMKKWVG